MSVSDVFHLLLVDRATAVSKLSAQLLSICCGSPPPRSSFSSTSTLPEPGVLAAMFLEERENLHHRLLERSPGFHSRREPFSLE